MCSVHLSRMFLYFCPLAIIGFAPNTCDIAMPSWHRQHSRNAQVSLPLYFLIYGAGQANFNLRAIEILFGNELYSAVSVATTVHQNADKLEGGERPPRGSRICFTTTRKLTRFHHESVGFRQKRLTTHHRAHLKLSQGERTGLTSV